MSAQWKGLKQLHLPLRHKYLLVFLNKSTLIPKESLKHTVYSAIHLEKLRTTKVNDMFRVHHGYR